MNNFLWALIASVIVSAISLIGALSLFFNEALLNKILFLLVGFSAGGLIGGTFLHLLPESLENLNSLNTGICIIIGFIFFFILEKYLHWRHYHKGKSEIYAFTYLNLIGDTIHNFIDGIIIGVSFFADIKIGITTTLAIIMHEIPQELGDFGVLVYGGFSISKALTFNFLSAITAVLGTALGFWFSSSIVNFSNLLLPIAAGGFIYIASCDLIPELHKQSDFKKSTLAIIFFILGVLLLLGLKLAFQH